MNGRFVNEHKQTLVALVVLALFVIGVSLIPDTERGDEASGASPYFAESLITEGIKRIGHPIEGFDANLLIMAFPTLLEEDFEGVASFEGMYRYRNGTLEFERTVTEPISSAERTVSTDGYTILLSNVSSRLGMRTSTLYDVTRIVEAILGSAQGVTESSLEGTVSIGPICPVTREGVPCETPPEAYIVREVVLTAPETGAEVARMNLDTNGAYHFTNLEPGVYTLDHGHLGIDSSGELPAELIITAGETAVFDFSIDTGIR